MIPLTPAELDALAAPVRSLADIAQRYATHATEQDDGSYIVRKPSPEVAARMMHRAAPAVTDSETAPTAPRCGTHRQIGCEDCDPQPPTPIAPAPPGLLF